MFVTGVAKTLLLANETQLGAPIAASELCPDGCGCGRGRVVGLWVDACADEAAGDGEAVRRGFRDALLLARGVCPGDGCAVAAEEGDADGVDRAADPPLPPPPLHAVAVTARTITPTVAGRILTPGVSA